jgi:Aspartyl protease/PDZ domain
LRQPSGKLPNGLWSTNRKHANYFQTLRMQDSIGDAWFLDFAKHSVYILSTVRIKPAITAAIALLMVTSVASAQESPTGLGATLKAVRAAAGAPTRTQWAGLVYTGRAVQGHLPSRVSGLVQFADSHATSRFIAGALTITQGFNGSAWIDENGIVGIVDLPGMYRDAVTQAYLAAQGWLNPRDSVSKRYAGRTSHDGVTYDLVAVTPAHGSTAILWFDTATHLLSRTVLNSDYGPDRTDYFDYRDAEGISWPFRSTEETATGSITQTYLSSVHLLRAIPAAALATPPSVRRSRAPGPVTVAMKSDARTYMAHTVLSLRIADRPVTVLFDSGGQNSIVPSAARRLGISSSGSIDVGGSGQGSESASIAYAGRVELGQASLLDQRFIVFPLPYEIVHPSRGTIIDGVVGTEFLNNFRITIDYLRRTLSLAPFSAPKSTAGVVAPFLSDGAHAYVWASIDGHRGLFSLDTGDSSGITLFGPFARRHLMYRAGGVRYMGLGIGGGDIEEEYRGRNFAIGGVDLRAPVVRVSHTSAGDFSSRSVAGNIGADVLSRFTVTFDYSARTVTFVPNATVHRPFREDMTGLTVVQHGPSAFVVVSVAAGSPAADAGVGVGDEVLNVNSAPVTQMGVKDFDAFRFGRSSFALTLRSAHGLRVAYIRPRPLLPPARDRE